MAVKKTSAATPDYNCVAWAAKDVERWWWPDRWGIGYWPYGVRREVSLRAFEAAFASLGYIPWGSGRYEKGYEKLAIFADGRGKPTHVARQLGHGKWSSKLGQWIDVEHARVNEFPRECQYGRIVLYLRRRKKDADAGQPPNSPGLL